MHRRLLAALLVVASVFAIGLALQRWLFQAEDAVGASEPPPPVALPAPVVRTAMLMVREVEGDVEFFTASQSEWQKLVLGSSLAASTVLRSKSGTAQLVLGDGIRIVLNPYSQFRLGELSATLSKVSLEGGRVTADVSPGGGRELEVGATGTRAVVVSRDGEFTVLRGADAQVTVATLRGSANLTAEESTVVVGQGQQAVAAPGEPPTPPTNIPGSLFVKLRRGTPMRLRQRSTTIRGETNPGTTVTVNGVQKSTKDGKFAFDVPLEEGLNTVHVSVADVLGRSAEEKVGGLVVDTRPPQVKSKIEW